MNSDLFRATTKKYMELRQSYEMANKKIHDHGSHQFTK